MLARKALEIGIQVYGTENAEVANSMDLLATVLGYFNDVDDDEVFRLREQAIPIFARVQGIMSFNVAMCESNLGNAYKRTAIRAIKTYQQQAGAVNAQTVHNLDQIMANLELALPRYREALRIYRAINHMDKVDQATQAAAEVEKLLRQTTTAIAAATRQPEVKQQAEAE